MLIPHTLKLPIISVILSLEISFLSSSCVCPGQLVCFCCYWITPWGTRSQCWASWECVLRNPYLQCLPESHIHRNNIAQRCPFLKLSVSFNRIKDVSDDCLMGLFRYFGYHSLMLVH